MKTILLTGFTPFGGESMNPSYECLKNIEDNILGYRIIKKEIETSFLNSHQQLLSYLDQYKPDAVILVGQAGGAKAIRIERIAINIQDASIEDNLGNMPIDHPIIESAPTAYFSSLPIRKIVDNLMDAGIPTVLSYCAGTFVCNHLLFNLLHYISQKEIHIPVGFIHVPYVFSQVTDKPDMYATDLDSLTKAIQIIIKTVIKESL
ncbi:pyroglutamyl-peptidase I [Mariniplasma anaerobium]|uniref:Pyrrolidone-carboxylate peptidase n=1 Tax=Mariniplasma anaerobium TaxID=2735436 RepID=A0A7U9XW02_9MOLU|nr:pyroglutamyl-peptidase I [Mariniplasma anaerobium]BCR35856.1 pyrrolidone-carboxylate peptidase [Mariniplasma anaerobium]